MDHKANDHHPPEAKGIRARDKVTYEIRVKDHLDTCWHKWFEGWSLTNLGDGAVSLRKTNVDQSALHGALNKIRDLNLTLLSVTRIVKDEQTESERTLP